jgi:hypothetical protein
MVDVLRASHLLLLQQLVRHPLRRAGPARLAHVCGAVTVTIVSYSALGASNGVGPRAPAAALRRRDSASRHCENRSAISGGRRSLQPGALLGVRERARRHGRDRPPRRVQRLAAEMIDHRPNHVRAKVRSRTTSSLESTDAP